MKHKKVTETGPRGTIIKWQVAAGVVIMLLLIGFLGRGYIRRNGIIWYGKVFILPRLSKYAATEFEPINATLSGLMVTMQPIQKQCRDYPFYQMLRISTDCSVHASSVNVDVTETFKNNWLQKAYILDKELKARGWESTDYDGRLKLQDLLTKDSYWSATYLKNTGKYECMVAIRYDMLDSQSEPLRINETCIRYIQTFGGY